MSKHLKGIALTAVATGMVLLATAWSTAAGGTGQNPGFPVLRPIMRNMGNNMQVIRDAITREDWARVAKTAPLLADRPQPSMAEKVRLLRFLGTKAGDFRAYDKKTRRAAQALELSAMRGDRQASLAAFTTLDATCQGCHRDFRNSFEAQLRKNP